MHCQGPTIQREFPITGYVKEKPDSGFINYDLYLEWFRNCLPFRTTWVHPRFLVGSCYSIISFICMYCRSLFVLLCFFFWPLCCLFFFDISLITPLVSSNSSSSIGKTLPLLLILANYVSRLSTFAIDTTRDNGEDLLFFPSHSSHLLPPLDVVYLHALKQKVADISVDLGSKLFQWTASLDWPCHLYSQQPEFPP